MMDPPPPATREQRRSIFGVAHYPPYPSHPLYSLPLSHTPPQPIRYT